MQITSIIIIFYLSKVFFWNNNILFIALLILKFIHLIFQHVLKLYRIVQCFLLTAYHITWVYIWCLLSKLLFSLWFQKDIVLTVIHCLVMLITTTIINPLVTLFLLGLLLLFIPSLWLSWIHFMWVKWDVNLTTIIFIFLFNWIVSWIYESVIFSSKCCYLHFS